MITNIKIISLNCRGLAPKEKRLDMFNKLSDDKDNIIFLKDVHWVNSIIDTIRDE